MAVFHLEETPTERRVTPINREERDLNALRDEISGYYERMQGFRGGDLREILAELAAMSARASEIRFHMIIGESRPQATFRTKQLDPFLDEIDRQFKTYSRIQTVREQEWNMSRAGV